MYFLKKMWVALIKLAASAASPGGEKLNFQAFIEWAAGAASLDFQGSPQTRAWQAGEGGRLGSLQIRRDFASSRLDHGLKV